MTISDFARSIGLSKKEYENYERIGEKVPEKIIKLVAAKYRVSIKWSKAEM